MSAAALGEMLPQPARHESGDSPHSPPGGRLRTSLQVGSFDRPLSIPDFHPLGQEPLRATAVESLRSSSSWDAAAAAHGSR